MQTLSQAKTRIHASLDPGNPLALQQRLGERCQPSALAGASLCPALKMEAREELMVGSLWRTSASPSPQHRSLQDLGMGFAALLQP